MRRHFRNASIIDASGAAPFRGTVTVEGEKIAAVTPAPVEAAAAPGDEVIDCTGMTLLPGMTEAHCHISFNNLTSIYNAIEQQPEDHALASLANAQLLLQRGWTSLFSAASAKPRLDVAVRDAINKGMFEGPRIRAASQEITPTGNLGDLDTNYLEFPRNLRFSVAGVKWIDEITVEVEGGYYEGNLSSSGNVYRVHWLDGRWVVVGYKMNWIS